MRVTSPSASNLFAALAIISFGGYIVWEGSSYGFGSLQRMGPGFFPIVIGFFLVAIGIVLGLEAAARRGAKGAKIDVPLRSMLTIVAGLAAFALLVRWLGLVPATISLVVLSLLAERKRSWRLIVGLSLALSAIGYFVFGLAFRMSLDPFWW